MNATTPDASLYAQRRARLAAQLGPGGIAIIPTAPERPRNRDTDFLYRHDSYFYYLTGFTEPNAWLVVAGDGRSTLWCQPKDLEREIWDGYRLGPEHYHEQDRTLPLPGRPGCFRFLRRTR